MDESWDQQGCMCCRTSVSYNKTDKTKPFLERGDHIEIPMEGPKGLFFNHHAIVETFQYHQNDDKWDIKVIEVSEKERKCGKYILFRAGVTSMQYGRNVFGSTTFNTKYMCT
ncbi:hypothetical protein DPMN_156690 [Dreissena polymorpha]|uniref:Uncharacterized protein n=1 Tax=Dreissena polymorpha TaxID=45954 RepID=A0A9D4FR56_DREPO|nr:hypothetical protein DPMN_156690 [Dreissena polymorpha]